MLTGEAKDIVTRLFDARFGLLRKPLGTRLGSPDSAPQLPAEFCGSIWLFAHGAIIGKRRRQIRLGTSPSWAR